MREEIRPLDELLRELREQAVCIDHYTRQERFIEEDEARRDYCGLLREICHRKGLDPRQVYHPLLGQPENAPAGVVTIF